MAQMQHTRHQIQERTAWAPGCEQENMNGMYGEEDPTCDGDVDQGAYDHGVLPDGPEMNLLRSHLEQLVEGLQQAQNELEEERAFSQQLRDDQAAIYEAAGQTEARLARENSELWGQVGEQRECIRTLNTEIEHLRDHVPVGGAGEMNAMFEQLQEAHARRRDADNEVQQLREQLMEERQLRERLTADHQWEKERLRSELMEARAMLREEQSKGGLVSTLRGGAPSGGALSGAAALATSLVPPPYAMDHYSLPKVVPEVAPFNRQFCGANVTLSEDGYTATRTRGCRQSVLVGTQPLPRQEAGWYFEVEIKETVEGWVGGLGMGVTRTGPGQLQRIPDKAWRMPHTFIVGYWGCVFLDGKERRTRWRADALQVGAKVGVLAAADGSGDLHVFVDGALVVTAEGALLDNQAGARELYPVVDVFAATLAVSLQPAATPPPQPWDRTAAALSPPGSPVGSMAGSMLSTSVLGSERR